MCNSASTAFALNKADTFLGVEPFHDTGCTFFRHWGDSFPTNWFDVVGTELLGDKKPNALIQLRWGLISYSANNLFHYTSDYTPVFLNCPICVL
jgi:hypothetical protein